MPKQEGSSEGKGPTNSQDESRALADPISTDLISKLMKILEGLNNKVQEYGLADRITTSIKRSKISVNTVNEEPCLDRKCVRKTMEAYNEESGASEDDFTTDGEVGVNPFENQP